MKSSKYLKYAIGEIVLVVVGILIALSINNWNQGRLERIEEKKLLQSLKIDFEETRNYFKRLNTRRNESLFVFNELFRIGKEGDFSNENYIDSLLAKTLFTPTYNGKTSSISIIVNSGKMNLLRNEGLKTMLLAWPQQVEDMTEGEQDGKQITLGEWIPFAQSYTSVNDWFKNFGFEGLPAEHRTSRVKKDYRGLFNDRKFENTITKMELLYTAGKLETQRLIEKTDEIIVMIDSDLK